MAILTVKKLRKTFPIKGKKLTAVDGVSFSVQKGEIFGLLGVNGAGKSTTINMLTGLTRPDSGSVTMFGKNYFKNEEECKQRCNVATAYYHLSHNLTALQNLKVFANLYNVHNPMEKIRELSEKFMVTHRFNTKVSYLSSGERTRLVIVKALLNNPEILFLDECTVGLDPDVAELVRDHLLQYNKETGCTIIFTSHYMQEVEKLCDRIAFMDSGKIVRVGNAHDLVKELQMQRVTLRFSQNKKEAKSLLRKEGIPFSEKGKMISFQIKNKNKVLYPLLEKFVKKKIVFDDIHVDKPTLEEYFIAQSRNAVKKEVTHK